MGHGYPGSSPTDRNRLPARIGPDTEVVDLQGSTLLPGFTDGHVHLLAGSFVLDRLLLLGVSSMGVMVTKVEAYAPTVPDEPWIVGYGWMRELVAEPDGRLLDAVVTDRPVLLVDNSGHSALVNRVALARAGITAETPDPPDGEIVRDPVTGEPTGYLLEGALSLVSEVALADYDDERLTSGLDAAVAASLSAFEAVAARRGGLHLAHVFDHVVLIDPEDRARLAALGIVASMQPAHEIGTRAGDVAEDWGAERMEAAYDLRGMVEAGVPVALGTDWPVWPAPDALVQVWAATTQQREQNLDLEDAVEAGTLGGAAALGRGAELGSLDVGKLADLVIYDQDPLAVDPAELTGLTLQQVWVGGERVR